MILSVFTAGMLTRLLKGLYEWLASCDAIQQADLIFAFAGRLSRKLCPGSVLAWQAEYSPAERGTV